MNNIEDTIQEMIDSFHNRIEGLCVEYIKELIESGDLSIHTTQANDRYGFTYIPYRGKNELEQKITDLAARNELLEKELKVMQEVIKYL